MEIPALLSEYTLFTLKLLLPLVIYLIYLYAAINWKSKITHFFLILASALVFSGYTSDYIMSVKPKVPFGPSYTIRKYGRITSLFIEERNRKKNLERLSEYANYPSFLKQHSYDDVSQNIHIIVLESFFDIASLEIESKKTNEYQKLIPELDFFEVTVPVYGGGTAKTEFEILTGLASLGLIEYVDFNLLFKPGEDNWVYQLKQIGHLTAASISTSPRYFNSLNAYKALGFEDVKFLGEMIQFKEQKVFFDGDLFDQNIKDINNFISLDKPFVNYVLGSYGHTPFVRDLELRPDLISYDNPSVHRLMNQHIYRIRALKIYLDQLIALDPQGLILVIGDHLPAILNKNLAYKKEKYITTALLYNNGEFNKLDRMPAYELIIEALSLLTNNNLQHGKEKMQPSYLNFLWKVGLYDE
ncbi:MAG: hypothetical protein GY820_34125 [Gammaproteobacteria bacterium]|nr:hypothetical protein [Gammaproteobacteria bacterium]